MSSRFQPTRFYRPRSEDEVVKQLKEFGGRARVVAGGTGIYELANRELLSEVEALVDISNLGLSYLTIEGGWMRIGATTTMAEMLQSRELLSPGLLALHDALHSIQPLQVKNVATIGGAICTALPFFDLPVALMALDAHVVLAPSGRKISLEKFVKGYFDLDIAGGEFVREVDVRAQDGPHGSAFQKFALTSDDWALVNCAVSVTLQGKRTGSIRVFFGGGVGAKPARAATVEKALTGSGCDETAARKAFEATLPTDLQTISDTKASADYRLHLAGVLGRRTFLLAAGRALGGG